MLEACVATDESQISAPRGVDVLHTTLDESVDLSALLNDFYQTFS